MIDFEQTIISEYANSPILVGLITNMNENIDPTANLDDFYEKVWNVLTAEGFGLDILGRIIGVIRNISVPADTPNPGVYVFTPGIYSLDDDYYRKLLLVKALANISTCSVQALNQMMTNLFGDRGRCYVRDTFNMTMVYQFEFYLEPFEYSMLTTSGAIPRPVGVQSTVFQVDVLNTFGFAGTGLQPFNQGTFYNG